MICAEPGGRAEAVARDEAEEVGGVGLQTAELRRDLSGGRRGACVLGRRPLAVGLVVPYSNQ